MWWREAEFVKRLTIDANPGVRVQALHTTRVRAWSNHVGLGTESVDSVVDVFVSGLAKDACCS